MPFLSIGQELIVPEWTDPGVSIEDLLFLAAAVLDDAAPR
jgi:hypothetical protein